MRYVNPRGRSGVLAANLYGSSLQNIGAGPFTIAPVTSVGPFPQWWAYVGAVAVVLNLPSAAAFPGNQGWLFAIENNGTAAASVQVRNPDASVAVTLAIGESAFVAWDVALLTYGVIGKWTVAGSSNPWTQAIRTGDLLRTSSTVADGVLQFAVTNGLRYRFRLSCYFLQAAPGADFRYGFSAPAITVWNGADRGYPAGGPAYAGAVDTAIPGDRTLGVGATALAGELQYSGIFTPSASGTLSFLWGSSGVANITVRAGSNIEYQVV